MAAHSRSTRLYSGVRGDFAASLGLTPRQDGTGGKAKLGPISKRGNGYLRRLLVNGATSVFNSKRAKQDPWLVDCSTRKHRKAGGGRAWPTR